MDQNCGYALMDLHWNEQMDCKTMPGCMPGVTPVGRKCMLATAGNTRPCSPLPCKRLHLSPLETARPRPQDIRADQSRADERVAVGKVTIRLRHGQGGEVNWLVNYFRYPRVSQTVQPYMPGYAPTRMTPILHGNTNNEYGVASRRGTLTWFSRLTTRAPAFRSASV